VILLLMVCFEYLNLITIAIVVMVDNVGLELEKNIFGMGASLDQLRIPFVH
jgi:hypothetical protein